jgi:hypothetical protein
MSHMMMMMMMMRRRRRRRSRRRRPIIAPIRAGGALVVAAALGLVVGEHGPQVARLHTLAKHGSWAHVCMSGMRHASVTILRAGMQARAVVDAHTLGRQRIR